MNSDPQPQEPKVRDLYDDLGVLQDATLEQIKDAFRRLAKLHHPDKIAPGQTVDATEFRMVRDAYEILSNEHKRFDYDKAVRAGWEEYHIRLHQWQGRQRTRKKRNKDADEYLRHERERKKEEAEVEKRRKESVKGNIVNAQRRQKEAKNKMKAAANVERLAGEQEELFKAAAAAERLRRAEKERRRLEAEQAEQLRKKREEDAERLKNMEAERTRLRKKQDEAEERSKVATRKAQERLAQAASERLKRAQEKDTERQRITQGENNNQYDHTQAEEFGRGLEEARIRLQSARERLDEKQRQEEAEKERKRMAEEEEKRVWLLEKQRLADQRSRQAAEAAQARNAEAAQERLRMSEEQTEAARASQRRKHPATEPMQHGSAPKVPKVPKTTPSRGLKKHMAREWAARKHQERLVEVGGKGNEELIMGEYIDIGWEKKIATQKCDFCYRKIVKWMFECPDGGAIACWPCKNSPCYRRS